jgi:hypothetical protein
VAPERDARAISPTDQIVGESDDQLQKRIHEVLV